MKKIVFLFIIVAIACSLFANDFQRKVFEVKKGPASFRSLEVVFQDDSILMFDTKTGTYTEYPYDVIGGTILVGESKNPDSTDYLGARTIPYVLKDGTAVLELNLGYDTLVLYDTGRKQYRSDLAFGIVDKTVAATALISGTIDVYQNFSKFYEINEYVKSHNGEAPAGYKGGRQFMNYEGKLPQFGNDGNVIVYREYDVNPWVIGVNRGPERLIIGSDGKSYITVDHYQTFVRIQ